MATERDKQSESQLEEGQRDTEIRRDTQVRGSLGMPPSGSESSGKVSSDSDMFEESESGSREERMRGSESDESESER